MDPHRELQSRRSSLHHRVRFEAAESEEPPPISATHPPTHGSFPAWNIPDYQAPQDRRVSEAIAPDSDVARPALSFTKGDPTDQASVSEKSLSSVSGAPQLPEIPPIGPFNLTRETKPDTAPAGDIVGDEDLSRPILGERGGPLSDVLKWLGWDQYNFDRELQEAQEDDEAYQPMGREEFNSFLNDDEEIFTPEDRDMISGGYRPHRDLIKDIQRHMAYKVKGKKKKKIAARFKIEYNISCR